jgi:NAD(P)-dependent dehydrogenase (short-subunit alcohol dehydrogenase family)
MNIKGKEIIITGAASGIGAETARYFSSRGAKVHLWDMNYDAVKSLAHELNGTASQCDVTNSDSIVNALSFVDEPRGLINCAGILAGQRVVNRKGPADLDHFQRIINVNLIGAFNVMRLVCHEISQLEPVNEDGERGVIVHTASIAAFEGQIGQAAYAASKAGITGMILPAARDMASIGIRVMAIAPGAVNTPMIGEVSEELQKSLAAGIPFPSRMAKSSEFAQLAEQIFENNYLNGTIIRLDGAARLAPK